MKTTTSWVCQECGYESPKFLGRCPECNTWNSLKEFQVKTEIKSLNSKLEKGLRPKRLSEIAYEEKSRLSTGFSQMDGVLGGGIVRGSVVLLAGDPGIGKSTLLLQIALTIAKDDKVTLSKTKDPAEILPSAHNDNVRKVLYISGEESEEQIKLRALRLALSKGGQKEQASLKKEENLFLVSTTNTNEIVNLVTDTNPSLVIIDSIQTMESENLSGLSGSVGQVRYAASQFIKIAKNLNIPVVIVGHVTKEGMVAGPMVLSHMVDTLLFLEGEKAIPTRVLRSLKNRFGPIDEVGIFSMQEAGMVEIKDSSHFFLDKNTENSPGAVLTVTLEGTRVFLVEIQALVVLSKLPVPRRVTSGIDYKRLELLLAVLQKHCHMPLDTMDVFVNVAGGLKLSDRASDLGVCLAIFSSFKNIVLSKTVGIAEVGLLGELRSIPNLEKRIREAKRLGLKTIISTDTNKKLLEALKSLSK